MNTHEYLTLSDEALLAQCKIEAYRASGPGGQHRNKTSSAVRLRHLPTSLTACAEEDRSQHVNKRRALKRLRRVIAMELLDEVDLDTASPSLLLQEHIRGGRIEVGARNPVFVLLAHELLSLLQAAGGQVSEVAKIIGVNTAHVVKFFEQDDAIWRKVLHIRQLNNLRGLKK